MKIENPPSKANTRQASHDAAHQKSSYPMQNYHKAPEPARAHRASPSQFFTLMVNLLKAAPFGWAPLAEAPVEPGEPGGIPRMRWSPPRQKPPLRLNACNHVPGRVLVGFMKDGPKQAKLEARCIAWLREHWPKGDRQLVVDRLERELLARGGR